MPAESRSQLKYIYAMRTKYKTKKNAPKHLKWVFNKEWTNDIDFNGLPTKVKSFKTFVSDLN